MIQINLLHTVRQTARLLATDTRMVVSMMARGQLRAVDLGYGVRIPGQDILKIVELVTKQ